MSNGSGLESRVAELEKKFADVEKLQGIPGPRGERGRPGCIESAVRNAEESTKKRLTDTNTQFAALNERVRDFDGKLELRIRESIERATDQLKQQQESFSESTKRQQESFSKNMENEVASIVVKVLQEYWLLDSECRVLDHLQRPSKPKNDSITG